MFFGEASRETEVSQLNMSSTIEKDVVRFDVTGDDQHSPISRAVSLPMDEA